MTSSASRASSHSTADVALGLVLRSSAWLAGALVLVIAAFVAAEASPALARIGPLRFLTDASWHPTSGSFGMAPMLVASVLTSLGAIALATPFGIVSAVFCNFYAPRWLAEGVRRAIELFAGIPSVVFGFWGLVVLVPLIGSYRPPGPSLFAAIVVLAMMILPTIALLADASLASVPRELHAGAAALGLSRWTTIRRVALPAARGGLVTATILATGRALGETMAVLMVAGNVVALPTSAFDPVRTLPGNVALEMAYALGDHRAALFASGLLLVVVVAIASVLAPRTERARDG